MTNFASDYGYHSNPFARCVACGSYEPHCCDGTGKRLSFDNWAACVDSEICRINGTATNDVTAPYAEMYLEGLSVAAAVDRALR